jgi:hypothetical protein
VTPEYRQQPVEKLGRGLQILLAVAGVLAAINDIWLWSQLRAGTFVLHMPPQGSVGETPYLTGSRLSSIGIVVQPVSLATIVVWLIWQHHATSNLWARGYRDLRIRPGWAVGWWFIPFANFVMPCVAMVELDRRSTTDGSPRSTSPLVGSWWAVYIGGSLVVSIGLLIASGSALADLVRAMDREQTVFDLTSPAHAAAPWLLALGIVTAIAAGLAIAVVRRITDAQTAMVAAPSAVSAAAVPMRPDLGI